jgi:ankyrin repeat protein
VDFLESDTKVEASSQALQAPPRPSFMREFKRYIHSQEFPRQITGLHLTAYFGVEEATNVLLQKGVKANSIDSYSRTPLSYTARSGHEAVIKLLLANKRVDADSKNRDGRTPLSYAAQRGHEAVMRLS